MGPEVPYCVHKPLVLILSQLKSVQIPTPYFCTYIFRMVTYIYTHATFVVILCYGIHFHWTEPRNMCHKNKRGKRTQQEKTEMIAKIVQTTRMIWNTVSRVHCIWTMEEFSLAVSVFWIIYMVMQNMLTSLVAHGFWLCSLYN